jgi:hypothetical protein
LRSHFGVVFSHIDEAPVLDALLRKTHWLKDHQLQLCMHQVTRGTWWTEHDMVRDIERRPPEDAAAVAEWLAVSGMHDVMQDGCFERIRAHAKDSVPARLRLLRIAMGRRRGSSVQLLRSMLSDTDERIMRMAAREIVRRKPTDYEKRAAPAHDRRTAERAQRHQPLDRAHRVRSLLDPLRPHGHRHPQAGGRAMLKLLPDGVQRPQSQARGWTDRAAHQALTIVQELQLAAQLRRCSSRSSRTPIHACAPRRIGAG